MLMVFVSAWTAELEGELRGTELAADDYIQVPFSLSDAVTRAGVVLAQQFPDWPNLSGS